MKSGYLEKDAPEFFKLGKELAKRDTIFASWWAERPMTLTFDRKAETTKSGIYIRAKTSDDRWTTVDILQLDERSFRVFVAIRMSQAGMVIGLKEEMEKFELRTPFTKEQLER